MYPFKEQFFLMIGNLQKWPPFLKKGTKQTAEITDQYLRYFSCGQTFRKISVRAAKFISEQLNGILVK